MKSKATKAALAIAFILAAPLMAQNDDNMHLDLEVQGDARQRVVRVDGHGVPVPCEQQMTR